MADTRFFTNHGPFALGDIATHIGATVGREADASRLLHDVAPLHEATEQHICFFENKKYREQFMASKAGACVVHPAAHSDAPHGMALLLHEAPYAAYASVQAMFYPQSIASPMPSVAEAGIAKSARIHASAKVSAFAFVGERAEIGEGSVIGHGTVIGPGTVVGKHCLIGDAAVVTHSILDDHVVIFPGAKIGQDGFGYAPSPTGIIKVPQLGRVLVGKHVHIGANCTIDRGSLNDTIIGEGCKLDNLVHLAHNVVVEPYCILVGQVGISGSTKIGMGSILGGQSGVVGHATIGKKVQIAAKSAVMGDVADGQVVGGIPAVPIQQWRRQCVAIARLVGGRIKAK